MWGRVMFHFVACAHLIICLLESCFYLSFLRGKLTQSLHSGHMLLTGQNTAIVDRL